MAIICFLVLRCFNGSSMGNGEQEQSMEGLYRQLTATEPKNSVDAIV